jgi:anaerobic selenocysteine-containing dehydrogenase
MRKTVQSNCHYCGYLCGFLATIEVDEVVAREVAGQAATVAEALAQRDAEQKTVAEQASTESHTQLHERLVNLAPDPTRYPYDERIINGCKRWRMNLTQIDAPERINYPLRRVGERGSGQWERISWDTALDEIAIKLSDLAEKHGPQTLASAIGGPHATYWPLHRFMNLWGSPNNMGIGQICWNIRIWMDALSYGWPIEVNVDPATTEQLFLWGTNPAQSDNSLFWRTVLKMCRRSAASSPTAAAAAPIPLVVIDPRTTGTARIATLHLAPRPGTDCTLALALIRTIIVTDRYDHTFVERWCHGFDELVTHVQPYTLEHAEKVTGVPAADIAAAAEIFSRSGPTALLSGRGVDQLGPNTAPTHRALSILRALTGDVDRPGACYIMDMSDFVPEVDLEKSAALTPEARATQLNEDFSPLQSYSGYAGATHLTARLGRTAANPAGNRLPMRYLTSAHPNLVWRAALGEWAGGERGVEHKGDGSFCLAKETQTPPSPLCSKPSPRFTSTPASPVPPYRITALICMAANPLVTYADTKLVYRALKNLELLVVLEYYMTPTAQLADYVLPSAGAFERPLFQAHGGVANFAYGGAAALAPYYERRADYDFFRSLGMRLGQQDDWPSSTFKDALEATLRPTGMNWDAWTARGIYCNTMTFAKHELPGEHNEPQGFATTTGKLELANEYLEQLGSTRLPVPADCHTLTNACSLQQTQQNVEFPLTLITGARMQPYWASSYFNNPDFRREHPYPTAQMSASTLASLTLKTGDWVIVQTASGSAKFRAEEAQIIDGVVSCEYGWWYPEQQQGEPHLGGIWRSNVNLLTNCDIETCEPLIGTWTYNGIPCKVCLSKD